MTTLPKYCSATNGGWWWLLNVSEPSGVLLMSLNEDKLADAYVAEKWPITRFTFDKVGRMHTPGTIPEDATYDLAVLRIPQPSNEHFSGSARSVEDLIKFALAKVSRGGLMLVLAGGQERLRSSNFTIAAFTVRLIYWIRKRSSSVETLYVFPGLDSAQHFIPANRRVVAAWETAMRKSGWRRTLRILLARVGLHSVLFPDRLLVIRL